MRAGRSRGRGRNDRGTGVPHGRDGLRAQGRPVFEYVLPRMFGLGTRPPRPNAVFPQVTALLAAGHAAQVVSLTTVLVAGGDTECRVVNRHMSFERLRNENLLEAAQQPELSSRRADETDLSELVRLRDDAALRQITHGTDQWKPGELGEEHFRACWHDAEVWIVAIGPHDPIAGARELWWGDPTACVCRTAVPGPHEPHLSGIRPKRTRATEHRPPTASRSWTPSPAPPRASAHLIGAAPVPVDRVASIRPAENSTGPVCRRQLFPVPDSKDVPTGRHLGSGGQREIAYTRIPPG
ncbi:hypothetical protein GA0115254_1185108 [Streptomyces sp. Ncost-T10-10d]|nr:hypothetical protein GA0115254_1185108 [Streptomyces sp. Ncost-T10-10d]